MIVDLQDPLILAARAASRRAYAPYSNFRVGAALTSTSGAIYTGCNIENASYGATICAERVAVAAMVAQGEQQWIRLAVATDVEPAATPCGICLQVLVEFAEDGEILLVGSNSVRQTTLRALLPSAFGFEAGKRSEG